MLLVTGITGHSGTHFLRELIANNYRENIRCLVRNTSDTSLLDTCGLNIEKVVGDLNDLALLNSAMQDVVTVLHIASAFRSKNVICAALRSNVKRVILVHTAGVYSKYKSAIVGYKKIEADINEAFERNGSTIGLVYLRPTMIYGNVNDRNMAIFIKMVDKLRIFPIIDHGMNMLQPVNGADLGKAYYELLSRPEIMNGDYILSGEKPISMLEVFQTISKLLGRRTAFVSIPLSFSVFMAKVLRTFSFGSFDYVEQVQRMGEDRNYPHTAAARDFGYDPMPFEVGLRIEIEQYLKISHRIGKKHGASKC